MRDRLFYALSHNHLRVALCFLSLFILVSVPVAAQVTSPRPDAETKAKAEGASGSITGRVTGEDGRPLAEAQVAIYGAFASTTARMAMTDTSGRFQFKDLPPRPYIMRAILPGYVEVMDDNRSSWETRYISLGESVQLTMAKGGVITGTILSPQGEPMVAASVRAIRVRDAQGRRAAPDAFSGGMPRMTDDRGIYRIYGLQPGSYIVMVGGTSPFNPASLYEADVPTYYPSSTRDTAMEVAVRSGEEATGIDIRYRSERGHIISGVVTGMTNPTTRYAINMLLTRVTTGVIEAQAFVYDTVDRRAFSLNGIADGEYELVAQGFLDKGEVVASLPTRVTVRGADVTGLQLPLTPLASLSGRITLEPVVKEAACSPANSSATPAESFIITRREDFERERVQPPILSSSGNAPNERGEFTLRNLSAGIFRLTVRPPNENWYVRAVSIPQTASSTNAQAQQQSARANQSGTIAIKNGERVTGISINLVAGAANLRGRVASQAEGVALPANLRAYLVPTERERADDQLRYAEANVMADGSFTFANLAPGRYWIIVRPAPQDDTLQPARMLAWDEETRKALRRDAEAANNALELKPCQRLTDYQISYAAK